MVGCFAECIGVLKYLLLLALGYVIYRLMRRAPKPRVPPTAIEDMVRCRHCGIHLPKSDALADGSDYFSNESHHRLWMRPR